MTAKAPSAKALLNINPDAIRPNPENPRMIFREQEMNELLKSIAEVGIQVPITAYEDRGYVILDGERRWRCAKRLNLAQVPCIVQPKPTRLENLLMMFNIHNVRVQWDIMPMAFKLADIRNMIGKAGQDNSARSLSAITGVRLPTVKRCLELLELPDQYKDLLMEEAKKPKSEQKITADLFIEINKAFSTVSRYVPETAKTFDKEQFVSAMVNKYEAGDVKSVTEFRELSKLARAERAGVSRDEAIHAITKLVRNKRYSVSDAYRDTVESAYLKRDLLGKIESLHADLKGQQSIVVRYADVKKSLSALGKTIGRILA